MILNLIADGERETREKLLKTCKTCQFWSLEKKGFCQRDNQGVGQFWSCEHWQVEAPGNRTEKAKKDLSCQTCAIRTH
jgi:hypothetical protein